MTDEHTDQRADDYCNDLDADRIAAAVVARIPQTARVTFCDLCGRRQFYDPTVNRKTCAYHRDYTPETEKT